MLEVLGALEVLGVLEVLEVLGAACRAPRGQRIAAGVAQRRRERQDRVPAGVADRPPCGMREQLAAGRARRRQNDGEEGVSRQSPVASHQSFDSRQSQVVSPQSSDD